MTSITYNSIVATGPTAEDVQPTLAPELALACDRAAGRSPVPPEEELIRVRAARRDISCRGRINAQWYRLALLPGESTPRYFSEEREPHGMSARDRDWTGYGEVPAGTLLLEHDRGRPISAVWLVHRPAPGAAANDILAECPFRRRVDGRLDVTLPDGTVITIANPRRP